MPNVVVLTRPDTSDMLCVHRVFREAFCVAPQLLGALAADDTEQAERISTYYEAVLLFLHIHHEGEDELLWPRLLQRCPDEATAVQQVADQHGAVLAGLAAAEERLAAWRAEPSSDRATSLAVSLALLGANLAAHLDDEERVVLPLAAQHLTAPEWAELPQHGMRTGSQRAPHVMWLVMGLIREQMSAEQLAHMDAAMPPPVHQLWVEHWHAQFTAFVTALRS